MAEEPETKQQEEPKEEKLFAGKYKSADELEKAYKEAEKTMHTKAQQLAETEKRIKELEESQKTKEIEPNDDLAEYEYISKKQFLESNKKLQDNLMQQFKTQMNEMQGFVQASMELSKIRQSHPELPENEIRSIINEFPEETDFDEALKKRRESIAKAYGLFQTPPKETKAQPPMPGQLRGVEQFGVENEDRSRIDRMKKAGEAGSIKTHLTKK